MNQGDLIQERFRLDERLGKGGMAEVWRAVDERLERPVAIKFLSPQFSADPEFLVRFFTEAQSVAQISHPNVVSVLDFGEYDEKPYLVMEHVSQGSLAEVVGEPVAPERALAIVADAARGMGAAHHLGIVHRDIKPANILLADDGHAKIADFGIALTAVSEKLTATGHVIGSPHYISPEQASGAGAGPESDVYALGIVLYELVTGEPPFDADNATAIAIAHVDKDPEPPSTVVPGLPAELDALVMRCLAKGPRDRFRDGDQLAAAIEDMQAGRTAVAVPTAAVLEESTDEFATGSAVARTDRRPLVASVIALVLLTLVAAGVWAALRPDGAGSNRSGVPFDSEPGLREAPEDDGFVVEDVPDGSVRSPARTRPKGPDDDDDDDDVTVTREGGGGGSGDGISPEPSEEPSDSPEPEPTPTE